jgi:glycosyltransferase involved in cell wall biosynthesis
MLLLSHGGSHNAQGFRANGIECRVLPWQDFSELHIKWILQQLQELEPDVFVPNTATCGYLSARWAREAGIPTIAAHRSDDAYHWGMVEQFVTGPAQWAASGLVCVNRTIHDRVQAMQPASTRLCVIPSGVPIPSRISTQDGPLKIAYVGRFEQEQKRVLDVARAICVALTQVKTATAAFFGDGSERARIEAIIRENSLADRIQLRGLVPPTEIQEQLAEHSVIVLMSDYEGMPGALMDGMACGLVPISTDIPGGVRELVLHEETGLRVQDRLVGFVDAIRRLDQDAFLRRRLAAAARQHVIDSYSLKECASRWENFCARLLADAGTRRAIVVPSRFHLPPVHPALAREDVRLPTVYEKVLTKSRNLVAGARKRLGGILTVPRLLS